MPSLPVAHLAFVPDCVVRLPNGQSIRVRTPDDVWPAAAAMCRWQSRHAALFAGASVLELGAGAGTVGLYAAGVGASHVVLTDREEQLDELTANVALNRDLLAEWDARDDAGATSRVQVRPYRWSLVPHSLVLPAGQRFDWVLGSDVTYAHESYAELVATLAALLRPHAEGTANGARPPRVVLAHEHRSARRTFGRVIQTWEEHDGALAAFAAVAASQGLALELLEAERPMSEVNGAFRRWTADISLFEVVSTSE